MDLHTVKQGQVVAYMDDSNLQGQLTQAKGQVAQAEANLQQLVAGNRPQDIAQSQAVLEQAEASLQQLVAGNRPQDIGQAQARLQDAQTTFNQKDDDFRRNQQLYDAGAISLQTLNQERRIILLKSVWVRTSSLRQMPSREKRLRGK